MKSNAIFARFPNHRTAIAELRSTDAVFDEICRDFQLLSDELNSLNTKSETQSLQFALDVTETLTGLQDEIVLALRRAGKM